MVPSCHKNVVFRETKIGVRKTEFLTLHRPAILWKRTDIRTVSMQLTPPPQNTNTRTCSRCYRRANKKTV